MCRSRKSKKDLFFEKKNQKTFTQLYPNQARHGTAQREQKFFGSFFQKRTLSS
jgi:hypothetical protein